MSNENKANYHVEFFKSKWNAWLALATLGAGFVSGSGLGFLIGIVAYIVGALNLPNMPIFKNSVDAERNKIQKQIEAQKILEFRAIQNKTLSSLDATSSLAYGVMVADCEKIEQQAGGAVSGQKLDEIMWAYLKVLKAKATIGSLMASKQFAGVAETVSRLEKEIEAEDKKAKEMIGTTASEAVVQGKFRLLSSKRDRLNVLKATLQKFSGAEDQLAVLQNEQERLEEQVKLLLATALSSSGPDEIATQVDSAIGGANISLGSLSTEMKGGDTDILAAGVPQVSDRVGYRINDRDESYTPKAYVLPNFNKGYSMSGTSILKRTIKTRSKMNSYEV